MPGDCGPNTKHRLCVTLSISGTLTIEFPHRKWATTFSKFLKRSTYHQGCNPRIRGRRNDHVRLDLLPKKTHIDRVQFRGEGDHLTFKFDKEQSAQDWCEGSGLWSISKDGGHELQVTLPLCWTHQYFEACIMSVSSSTRSRDSSAGAASVKSEDVVESSGPSYAPDD
ncbi:hypothetical protein VPNG_05127 [Cytospora leucostoma]|uniref:Uncharacterized protein n=1 Tax=Cytospora leucostoma TaxID=1230097 RepID=A0A423X4S8_9PEZI|nr:hypothetical protein VPNG_05127 [Cytospora leucostoma]